MLTHAHTHRGWVAPFRWPPESIFLPLMPVMMADGAFICWGRYARVNANHCLLSLKVLLGKWTKLVARRALADWHHRAMTLFLQVVKCNITIVKFAFLFSADSPLVNRQNLCFISWHPLGLHVSAHLKHVFSKSTAHLVVQSERMSVIAGRCPTSAQLLFSATEVYANGWVSQFVIGR